LNKVGTFAFTKRGQFVTIQIHPTALVEEGVSIGERTKVWHGSHLRSGVTIGTDVVIGRNVYVGSDVKIGSRSKIQNNALIYEPAFVGEGVFIGPAVIFTNDHNPRAVNANGELKTIADWEATGVQVGNGASIGAGSICVAPLMIGRWAMVGAGSVVTRNVKDYALVVGNPAREIGWVGEAGEKLELENGKWICRKTQDTYRIENENLVKEEKF
jgi:acetyltransferase-like isoleucine patch superfamily enzyme